MTALKDLYGTDHQSLVDWICKEYGLGPQSSQYNNKHRTRRETIATRLKLYRDQITVPLSQVIDQIYVTPEMRETLKAYVVVSAGQNVSRRIVNEVASLYDRWALRTLPDADANERLRAEEKRLRLHFIHQEAHRLANLCNEAMIWQFTGIDDKTALRIVTPDAFDAIPDPRDPLVPAAMLLDFAPTCMRPTASMPHWEVWDDTYRYRISGEGRLVNADGSIAVAPEAHGLARVPWVLFHRREPTTCILDASYGEDIKSTHLAVALLDVMVMRLSKTQGENQPVLAGNLAAMVSNQTMNGENPLRLPPDVVASMLNMKTDPDHYLAVKKDKISSCAQSYGMNYEQFTNNDTAEAQSGKAYQVRREKLTELRLEQRGRAMMHESMVVELIGFSPEGLRVDFQEQAMPMDAAEEVTLLDEKMRKGLDSPVAYMMRKDPDLTRELAIKQILDNLQDYAMLIVAVRALNVPANGDAGNPGQSPQENGAMGGPKPKDPPPPPGPSAADDPAAA